MDVIESATGELGASHEGVTAESDPEPRVPSEESCQSSSAVTGSESCSHVDTFREDSQCSTPKESAPHLGDPKEAARAPRLPDTFRLIDGPSTEPAASKGTTPDKLTNQEEEGSTSPSKEKLQGPNADADVRKDAKAAGITTGTRRNIPPKRDRMDPLKLDMTKPTVMPLTSSQLSLQCLECHIIFSDDRSKQRHLKMSHPAEYEQCVLGDSLFACYVCDRHFANSTELMAHQRTHSEKHPFKCVLCGEAFRRSSELTTHKKIHCSNQGYKCSDCGKPCKTLTLLKYHSRTHTGEKPYVCKECGKRFSMPKSLQKHLEIHTQDEGEENGDGTNVTAKAKKQKSSAPSERKYSCPHCKAMFKTERTQLHHIKYKHAQNKNMPSSCALVTQAPLNQAPPLLTQAAIGGQPPVLRLDSGGQTPQCIEPEQIKRLIESLGNVQKVNQLVIYGLEPVSFQSQTVNLQPVPGVVQPIRFDMTPTVPSVELKLVTEEAKSLHLEQVKQPVESTGPELNGAHGETNAHSAVERTTQSVEQMQDHTGTINPETLQSQVVELEQICLDTERLVTVEEACSVVETVVSDSVPFRDVEDLRHGTKAVDTEQDNGQIQMLELQQSSSLIPTNELENENGDMVSLQKEVAEMECIPPRDTQQVATEALQHTEETQTVTLTSTERKEESTTNAGNDGKQEVGQPQLETSDETKDCMEQMELNLCNFSSEVHFSEEISVHTQPCLHESDAAEVVTSEPEPSSRMTEVVTREPEPSSRMTMNLSEPLKLKKRRAAKKTSKKGKSKSKLSHKVLKQKTDHNATVQMLQQKVLAPHPPSQLMTTVTQHARTKGHILVQFGLGNKKEKVSKTMEASTISKKRDDCKLQEKGKTQTKKKVEDGKGKTSTKPDNKNLTEILIKPQDQERRVLQKQEAKSQVTSRKRKLKICKSTSKSLTEKEVISAPLPKKKKQEKIKKSKPLRGQRSEKEVMKKNFKLKQKEREETPVAISPDQVKSDALLLLKGHKQPQLKVHKLDAPKTLSQLELVPLCQSVSCNEETEVAPIKQAEDHKNKLTKTKNPRTSIQACESQSSSNIKGVSMQKKIKASRKKKTTKTDGEMTLTSPSLTCGCGVKFSEISTLQEHVAVVHSGVTQGYQGCTNGTSFEEHVTTSVSKEVLPNDSNGSKTLGLQVTTDWDAEIEMGELGLGDREDQRLSFPALNPSPSLPHAPTLGEGAYEEVQRDANNITTEKTLQVVSSGSRGAKQSQTVACPESILVCPPPSQVFSTCLSESVQETTPEVQNLSAFSPLPSKHQKEKGEEGLSEAGNRISEIQEKADCMKTIFESDKVEEEDMKEELPLDINLVTVQDENQITGSSQDDASESSQKNGQTDNEMQVMSSHQNSHESSFECPSHTKNSEPVVDISPSFTATQSSTNPPEIKQEEVEMALHTDKKKGGLNRNNVTRGRKRGGGKGRRGASKKRNLGSRAGTDQESLNDAPDECQIVYQLYPVATDSEETLKKSLGGNGPQVCSNPSRSGLADSQEDSSEEQVVFELESVTTSVDMIKSEGELGSQDRIQQSSPGILLEKFLTSRGNESSQPADISNQVPGDSTDEPNNGTTADHRTTTLPSPETSGVLTVKEEDLSQPVMRPVLPSEGADARGPLINRSLSTCEQQQGVQMFVVKEEDPLILNEAQVGQQPSNGQRKDGHLCASTVTESEPQVESNIGERSVYRDELEKVTSTLHQPSAKQCIFFPVKEEERELVLECTHRGGNQSSIGVEEHDDICEISTQHETQCGDSAFGEEDYIGADQHNIEDLVEFLLQSSDTEDSGVIDSEPVTETLAMSCYHGSRSGGSANPPVGSSHEPDQRLDNRLCQNGLSLHNGQRKPIDYFTQYFDSKTWQDIANITTKTCKMSNPVTTKEVSQFVGIHIAMGTLQFPSTKLYWEDYTRVALIADAMSSSRFSELLSKLRFAEQSGPIRSEENDKVVSATSTEHLSRDHNAQASETADAQSPLKADPLSRVRVLIEKVKKACQSLKREGNHGVSQYPLWLLRTTANPAYSLHHTVMLSTYGLVVDFSLSLDDTDREETVKKMVLSVENSRAGMVFLCKPELSTPSMLEQLLEAGVQSAGKVGGARGQVGDEFVSSDGKLKLFRCHHGFILSAAVKGRSRSTSLVSGFERALKAAKLNRDLRGAYHTPCLPSSPTAWPFSVLWHLVDLALVNSWLQYRGDRSHEQQPLSLMAFRLEVSKALILSSSSDAQDAAPPQPPAPERPEQGTIPESASLFETPLPDTAIRYDGMGHWPEQVAEGEGARCRFGGCDRTSQVRCLKCCVFLCISRSHNCFLKFHSQGTL